MSLCVGLGCSAWFGLEGGVVRLSFLVAASCFVCCLVVGGQRFMAVGWDRWLWCGACLLFVLQDVSSIIPHGL